MRCRYSEIDNQPIVYKTLISYFYKKKKNMLLQPTNIEDKLRYKKNKSYNPESVIEQIQSIFEAESKKETLILDVLSNGVEKTTNAFNFELLDTDKIYHINTIKTICIDYRLRFLDSKLFKNEFPNEAIFKIKSLEKNHQTKLQGFKVMAPSKLFKLKNPDDPLLFAPIGNGYYYLIHKWGNDLHPLRKWIMLPFRSFETLMVSAILSSFLITFLFNFKLLESQLMSSKFLILFLFMFKSVIGIIIFYAISQGKNFNSVIWNSKNSK